MRLAIIFAAAVACVGQDVARPGAVTPVGEVLPPAISRDGRIVAFASTMPPDGSDTEPVADLYIYTQGAMPALKRLTHAPSNSTFIPPPRGVSEVCLAPDGAKIVYTLWGLPGFVEEVHVVDTASGADAMAATDNQGCIQFACVGCAFACITTPHLSADGKKILYAARRDRPFYVANADGSGVTHLLVFSGSLAPAPQRVITRDGLVVFTSNAPSGPTFAPQAADVYLMNLDGSNIRQVTRFGLHPEITSRNAIISADGSLIAFESNLDPATNGAGKSQIWVVRPDGTGLRQLTRGADEATAPSIAADGSTVVFTSAGQAHAVSVSSSVTGNLTNYQLSTVQNPVVSDDGSKVAYALGPQSQMPGAVYVRDVGSLAEAPIFMPHTISAAGIVSAAGSDAPPASGSLVSIYGSNLGTIDAVVSAAGFPLPFVLGGILLLANNQPVPLAAVTPWQINAQLPTDVNGANTSFQVRYTSGIQSNLVQTAVAPLAPEPFSFSTSFFPGGIPYFQAAAYHSGSMFLADLMHPAKAGDVLEIYATGLGATTPVVDAGVAVPLNPPAGTVATPQVFIGTTPAEVDFSGLAPGLVGVYQINIKVPAGLAPRWHPLIIRMGSASSSGSAVIFC